MATSLNVIRTLTMKATTEGVAESAAALKGLQTAHEGVAKSAAASATVTDTSAKQQLSMAKSVEQLERRFNAGLRAQQDFEKVQRTLNMAVAQNPALQDRANAVLALARVHFDAAAKGGFAYGRTMEAMNSQAIMLSSRLGAVGNILSSMGPGGIAAAAGLGLMALAIKQIADSSMQLAERAGKLKDFSETTGFTVIQLQALEKAGAQVGVASESVTKGLERFSVAMDDVKQSTGPLHQALMQVDPVLAGQISRTGSLAEAWDLLAIAVQKAGLEQRNMIARQAFGRGGIEITRLLGSTASAGGLSGLIAELRTVDLITAQQADKWDTLGDKINENMKAAKQNVAAIFVGPALESLNSFSSGLLNLSRIAREFEWKNVGLFFTAAELGLKALMPLLTPVTLAWEAIKWMGSGPTAPKPTIQPAEYDNYTSSTMALAKAQADLRAETVRLYNEEKRNMDVLGDAAGLTDKRKFKVLELAAAVAKDATVTDAARRALAEYDRQAASTALSARIGVLGDLATTSEIVRQKQDAINEANRRGAKITDDEAEAIKRKAALLFDSSKFRNQLEFEREQIFRTEGEQEVFARLRAAGIDYNSVLGQIDASQIRITQSLKQFNDIGLDVARSFASDFTRELRAGASAMEALQKAGVNALNKIADKLIEMAINNLWAKAFGGGGGFDIFKLLGLGLGFLGGPEKMGKEMHTGGIVGIDGASRYVHPAYFDDAKRFVRGGIAGFGPDEIGIVAHRNEEVITRSDPRHRWNGGGQGGGATNMNLTIVVQGSGDKDLMEKMQVGATTVVKQALRSYDKNLPTRVNQIAGDPRVR